jgi:hypothetical protein
MKEFLRAMQQYSHLRQIKSWLTTATRKRLEVNKASNQQEMRDPTDHVREVPIGASETIRTVCKDTLQSLVTMSTHMDTGKQTKRTRNAG